MGILLNNSNYNPYSSNSITKALTEAEFISALSTLISRTFYGSNGSYTTIDQLNLGDSSNYSSYLPTASPVSNFTLTSTGAATTTTTEDDDYIYIHYSVPIKFTHIQSSSTVVKKGEFRDLSGRIMYWRKAVVDICCAEEEEIPVDDGYRGSEVITVNFLFVQQTRKETPVPPTPVVPTTFGAFPTGLGADYCYLICKSDENYASTWTIEDLDEMANDYAQTINPSLDELNYYGQDSNGIYVVVEKDSVDIAPELVADWADLYDSNIALENEVIQCEVNGTIKDCYKIYLTGQCQLIEFDGNKYLQDYGGGQTELAEYYLPNGYYVIIGRELRLFLLTTMDTAVHPYQNDDTRVKFNDNSTIGTGIVNLDSRVNYNNNRYYVYKGHETPNVSSVDANAVIFAEISNLRKIAISDSITSVGHFGGQANPDNGFYFPKHIQSIGPLTVTYSAQTSVYVPSEELVNISDNAFYNGTSTNVNMRLYLCENPESAAQIYQNGYFKPSNTLQTIGAQALYGIKLDQIDLTDAINLTFVGKEALAVDNLCKTWYLPVSKLSQRTGISNQNLIYVPDEVVPIVDQTAPYDSSNYNSATYADSTHKTMGTLLGGYHVYLR